VSAAIGERAVATRTAVLLVVVLVVVAAAFFSSGCAPAEPPRHLVLLTVDTWRADHIHARRAGVDLTPHLTELAADSVVFPEASSVSNATSPGVAGFLTGLVPSRSGVISNDHVLNSAVPTLAEQLSRAGFATAGIVANPVVGPGYGFEQGFDHYELLPRPRDYRTAKASSVNREAMSWLGTVDEDRRIFLWLHYMEPHGPYQPLPECAAMFDIDAFGPPVPVAIQPEGRNGGRGAVPFYQTIGFETPATDGRDYLLRYAAEVRCVDAGIGEMLDHLGTIGVLDEAVIAITGDHGEALIDDHGFYFSHANGLTEDQIAVPLMLSAPGLAPGTDDRPVSTVDIVPTVLALLGLEVPDHLDGTDLLGTDQRQIFAMRRDDRAVRSGRWKLVADNASGTPRLFDLAADDGESSDLAAANPETVESLLGILNEIDGRPVFASPVERGELDESTRDALRALGYLSD
jgi:arylsulfatase